MQEYSDKKWTNWMQGTTQLSDKLCYLSQDILESLNITAKDVTKSIEHLIRKCGQSQAWNAPKSVILLPDGRYIMAALAVADDPPFFAVKSLLLNPHNTKHGFKSINALVMLHDSDSGLPVAVLDGNWITAVRTAGLSALAATRMANADATVAAFIGCGVQAYSHLRALAEIFPLLKTVQAFSRGSANRDEFCKSAEEHGFIAIASKTARDAIKDADLIVSSVMLSPQLVPFLDARWLKPGAFVTMTDLATPWFAESLSTFDRIVIDDLTQEKHMQNPLVDRALISGDLSDLVSSELYGRSARTERTAFAFRGLALADLAVATLAYQEARKTKTDMSMIKS